MEVVFTGGHLTYEVSSADDRDGYHVDMAANEGNGECLCRDFQCRCFPIWRKEVKIVDYHSLGRTRCKHIQAVIMFLGNKVIDHANGKIQ